MQFAQLLFVDVVWRVGQQALGALGLREGDDVTNRLGSGHHGDDPVKAKGEPAVGRRAVLECVEEEAEFELRLFFTNAKRLEYLLLHIGTVDTDRSTTEFPAVERQIVGFGQALAGVGRKERQVFVFRAGEWVMAGDPALALFVVVEHRKIDNP